MQAIVDEEIRIPPTTRWLSIPLNTVCLSPMLTEPPSIFPRDMLKIIYRYAGTDGYTGLFGSEEEARAAVNSINPG